MIDSVEIENFRCFEKLSINDLGLVNVVVGESAAGKTSLLEAISIAMGGGPDLPFKFRAWRGLGGSFTLPTTRTLYEALWEDLFFQYDQRRIIHVAFGGTKETIRTFELGYHESMTGSVSAAAPTLPTQPSGPFSSTVITPITFKWTHVNDKIYTARPMPGGQVLTDGDPPFTPLAAFFSAAFMAATSPSEPANQFSAFSRKSTDAPLRRTLHEVFPQLKDISVESDSGTNVLYCRVPWMKVKVPIALVSSGVNKLFILLLGIATVAKGVVLIDELENSFYYKTYPLVWKSILHFCKRFKVQVFASTHSIECLRATLSVLKGNESDFRLLRVERKEDNRVVRVFRGNDFEAAMEAETEVR